MAVSAKAHPCTRAAGPMREAAESHPSTGGGVAAGGTCAGAEGAAHTASVEAPSQAESSMVIAWKVQSTAALSAAGAEGAAAGRARTPPAAGAAHPEVAAEAAARTHLSAGAAEHHAQGAAPLAAGRWHRATEVARGPALRTRPTKGSMGVFHLAGVPRERQHTTRGSPQGRSGRR